LSTPKGCSADGPVGVPNKSSAWKLCVLGPGVPAIDTITGAKTAIAISSTMNPSATIATLSRRSRRQNSCIGERAAIFCSAPPSWMTTAWSSASWTRPTGSPVLTRATSR
jgi:hypothetical protein